jgi:SAM-dependent methyltransferase
MPKPLPTDRSPDRVRHHYEVEKELAARLRVSSHAERARLYSEVYDELFRRVPDHPQLVRKSDPVVTAAGVARLLPTLRRFVKPDGTFLEVGPGDCNLSLAMATGVARCYAVDVSTEITRRPDWPGNFELKLSDGTSIPVPPGSVDLAYSNQLMEHLHPDDALLQLKNIHRALRPGGCYVCRTPNRLSGPHDVSAHYDVVATGFHLREYSCGELSRLFREVGFRRVKAFCIVRGRYVAVPMLVLSTLEGLLSLLPSGLRQRLAISRVLALLLGVNLVGIA